MAQQGEKPKVDGASTIATDEDIGSRSRNVAWYVKDLTTIPDPAREVFEGYSGIPSEKVHHHVYEVVCVKLHDHPIQFR